MIWDANLCCAKELSEQSHFLDNSLVKPCLHQAAAPQIAEKGAPQRHIAVGAQRDDGKKAHGGCQHTGKHQFGGSGANK